MGVGAPHHSTMSGRNLHCLYWHAVMESHLTAVCVLTVVSAVRTLSWTTSVLQPYGDITVQPQHYIIFCRFTIVYSNKVITCH